MSIRPTFYGFEMARTALFASQRNIDVTGQNIANVNTEGYSRQRVNLSAIGAGGLNWKYAVQAAENVGLGVSIDGIQRVRDQFLDVRYWKEAGDNTRLTTKADALDSVEMLLDEITLDNLKSILTDFNASLSDLHKQADAPNFASITRMIATTLTNALNNLSTNITKIKSQQIEQMALAKDDINSLAKGLSEVNTEIRNQTLLGVVSNELLDQRDLMIDQLSQYGNVRVIPEVGGGVSVYFGDGTNAETMLVDGFSKAYNTMDFDKSSDPVRLTWASGLSNGSDVNVHTGSIMGYYEVVNGIGDVTETGSRADLSFKGITYFQNMLDTFAATFSQTFNDINGNPLFEANDGTAMITAENIRISAGWQASEQYIKRSLEPDDPNYPNAASNGNVLRFMDALNNKERVMPDGFNGSFQQYVTSINSEIAVTVHANNRSLGQSDGLLLSVSNMRDSIKNVSEDEEAMNLVRFQKSYSAAARFLTTLDELLDVVVNKMGLAGR